MADKRITELDAITDLAAADVIPMTDVSADTGSGKTVKVRIDELFPAGGTLGQLLVKLSDDDFDYGFQDKEVHGFAQFNYELSHGSTPVNFYANTYTICPVNEEKLNTIAGAILLSGGMFTLPAGTFLIQAECYPFYTHRGAMYIKNESTGVFLTHGPTDYNTGASTYPISVNLALTLAAPTDLSVGAIKGRTERMGLPVAGYISGEPVINEVFASILIQKVA